MNLKMSRRAKLTLLLSVGTIINLCGYLYITGSWKLFLGPSGPASPTFKDVQSHRNAERELSQLLHKAINDHKLSHTNFTKMLDKFVQKEFENDKYIWKDIPKDEVKDVDKIPAIHGVKNINNSSKMQIKSGGGNKYPAETLNETAKEVKPVEDKKLEANSPKKGMIMAAVDNFLKGKEPPPVNPHHFNYIINEPDKCRNPDGTNKDVFLLVVICSVHKNFENRNAIRQSWGSLLAIDGRKVVTVFLLAKRSDEKLQNLVEEENLQYHDIIMEDFDDTYKNLTLKTMMGMKWMATFCSQAKYYMKTDDDMFVSYANMVNYLANSPENDFVTGMVIRGSPIRDPKSKWYMPKSIYPGSKYPPFCSGTGYAMSGDVPPRIYQTSLSTPYLYLEDVYVAICIDKLKIVPKNHREFHNWRTTYTFCHFKRILTAHMVTPTEMIRYWNDQKSNTHKC